MSRTLLYDQPGPRALRRERWASGVIGLVLLAAAAYVLVGMIRNGFFDDRWQVFTDPPKGQAAVDVWLALGRGLRATLGAAAVAAPCALILALLLAALRSSGARWVGTSTSVVVEFLRGMPVLLMMLFGLLALGLPAFGAVVFGLVLYNAAIVAEILRAGLAALPVGQAEAGIAIGLTRWQTLRLVQLPQVSRIMLPSLISQFVVLLKDSSLGFIVGYPELLRTMQLNYSFFGDRYRLPLFTAVLAIYLIVNMTLSRVALAVDRRLSVGG